MLIPERHNSIFVPRPRPGTRPRRKIHPPPPPPRRAGFHYPLLFPSCPLREFLMNRRDFLHTGAGAGAAALALSSGFHVAAAQRKTPRVGLIGCGWYGKCDLFRLIQVADVDVVSLCDVDSKMLAGA